MFPELAALLFVVVGAGGLVWTTSRWRYQVVQRCLVELGEVAHAEAVAPTTAQILSRARWLPWLLAAILAVAMHFLVSLSWTYSGALGLLAGLLGGQLESMLAQHRVYLIELQLADMIDLMVGALRAGTGVIKSLEAAVREIRNPLRAQMEEVIGRIRLGDQAPKVFEELTARVPLESFMLFSSALAVHWEVGGSLAPTLATVGRTIRDRIELSRRVRSMSAQSRFSTLGVLAATYAIAAIMWSSDPERMERFLWSTEGSFLVSSVMVLQAVGIVWSTAQARIKF
ncbi:MAG: type II secretion system F family protein [Planctomycetaceae bacterium]|nr:type II secretion system F family protein [Planctomycetaceae bacterium]